MIKSLLRLFDVINTANRRDSGAKKTISSTAHEGDYGSILYDFFPEGVAECPTSPTLGCCKHTSTAIKVWLMIVVIY